MAVVKLFHRRPLAALSSTSKKRIVALIVDTPPPARQSVCNRLHVWKILRQRNAGILLAAGTAA
jgi:hypothetical protein